MRYSNERVIENTIRKTGIGSGSSKTGIELKPFVKKPERQILLTTALLIFTLLCLLPMILVIVVAFSSEASIAEKGFSYFPKEWSLEAFKYIATFKGQLIQSYAVTIFETVVGTVLTLFFTGMFSYALSREDFMLRKHLTVFIIITMLVNGGAISSYLVNTNIYNLRNNLLILILPTCVSTFNCIVIRTFIKSNVPKELIEAAKIDGAGEVFTYFRIVLPLLTPVFAAIGFMCAVGHWNEWQAAFMYIDNPKLATLQLMLIKIEKSIDFLNDNKATLSMEQMEQLKNAPSESCRMAVLLCTLGPVLVAYPFFQKHFVKGLTVGAVKG